LGELDELAQTLCVIVAVVDERDERITEESRGHHEFERTPDSP
jgi:hypothetical protein